MHFSKQFVQTALQNRLPSKACNLLNIFSSSLKSNYLCQWTYQCPQNEKSLCHCSKTRVKMFCHVVNITMHFLNYGNILDHSYSTEIQKAALLMYAIFPFKSTHLKITVSGIKMFELLRISQYLAAPFSHCKPWMTTWSLFNLICTSVLGHFCLFHCFASVPFHHASLLLFFLLSVDLDRFLDIHPLSEFVTLVLSSVYMLSKWRFIKCTFELFQRTGL